MSAHSAASSRTRQAGHRQPAHRKSPPRQPTNHGLRTRRRRAVWLAVAACVLAVLSMPLGTTTHSTAVAPHYVQTANVYDSMNRYVALGFGTADKGGSYFTSPTTKFSVAAGAGHIASIEPGTGVSAILADDAPADEKLQSTFSLPSLPTDGAGVYYGQVFRHHANGDAYRVQVRVAPSGRMTLGFVKITNGVQTTIGDQVLVPQTATAGAKIVFQGLVAGFGPVQLEARAWLSGTSTPDWQLAATDSSESRLRDAGQLGLYAYMSSRSDSSDVSIDGFRGWQLSVAPIPDPAPTTSEPAPTEEPSSSDPPTNREPSSSAAPPPSADPATSAAPSTTAAPSTPDAPATTAAASTSRATSTSAHATTTTPAPTSTGSTRPPSAPPTSGEPGAANTGVPAGTKLTQHYGNMIITTPGATFDALDIHGFVAIQAPNVTITRSIIRGGVATSGNIGLVSDVDTAGTNFLLADSELVPEHPSVYLDGIKGWNYTLLRVDIHGTVDSAKVFGDNASIQNSWLHDEVYYAHDPNQGGGFTHNDGVQVLSGHNIHIQGNTIEGAHNAAMQVTQGHGVVSDLTFDGNWADGGGCSVNLNNTPRGYMQNISVTDNRFGHDTRNPNCPIVATTDSIDLTAKGNVYDDTGLPAPVRGG